MIDFDTARREFQPDLERVMEKAARFRGAQPFPPRFAASLEHKLRIEFTHGSTAIEGNTLTLRETQLLLDEGITPAGAKRLREIYETLNHHRAVIQVRDWVKSGTARTEESVCALHCTVMANIDDENAGRFRRERVMVTGAPIQPPRPERVPEEMATLLSRGWSTEAHPLLRAAELHYRFVKIHPFLDGNGRTARLLMNWSLLADEFPLTVIAAEDCARYIHAIDETCRGRPLDYLRLLCESAERSLDQYLDEET